MPFNNTMLGTFDTGFKTLKSCIHFYDVHVELLGRWSECEKETAQVHTVCGTLIRQGRVR